MGFLLSKLKNKKSGQGNLLAIGLSGLILSIIILSASAWYLSLHRNIDGMDEKLEAMTIATSEWQRLEHMSLDELEANRENYKTPYQVGDYKVSVNLGKKGYFTNGKCEETIPSGKYANCFKDTVMTIYDSSGERGYTTRTLPLMAGIYTREEIDDLLKGYVHNDSYNKSIGKPQIGLKYNGENKKVTAVVDGEEISLNPDIYIVSEYHSGKNWYRLWSNGWCEQGGEFSTIFNVTTYIEDVTLLHPFKDANYTVFIQETNPNGYGPYSPPYCGYRIIFTNETKTMTKFRVLVCNHFVSYYWRAEGFYE